MIKKEIYWFIGTIVFIVVLSLLLFGTDGFKPKSTIDINIHDTYYVVGNFHAILLLGVFVFFIIYLIRTLNSRFKSLIVNLVLSITIILLILIVSKIGAMIDVLVQKASGWTIYPPSSAKQIEDKAINKYQHLSMFSNIIFGFKLLLLILLAYCGFKTGQNHKNQ